MRKIITVFSLFCVIGFPVGYNLLTKPFIYPQNNALNPVEKRYVQLTDSMKYYYNKRHCYFRCGKTDSAYQVEKVYWFYLDSVSHYNNILFDSVASNNGKTKITCECN